MIGFDAIWEQNIICFIIQGVVIILDNLCSRSAH